MITFSGFCSPEEKGRQMGRRPAEACPGLPGHHVRQRSERCVGGHGAALVDFEEPRGQWQAVVGEACVVPAVGFPATDVSMYRRSDGC